MAWTLRLVKAGTGGERACTDVMEIRRPDDLRDIANLGLTLAEAKRLLAGVQQEIVAVQAKEHAVWRPDCSRRDGIRHVKAACCTDLACGAVGWADVGSMPLI